MNRIDKIEIVENVIFMDCKKDGVDYRYSSEIPICTYVEYHNNFFNYIHSKYKYLENINIVSFILFCLDDFRNNRVEFLNELSKIEIEYLDDCILLKYKDNVLRIKLLNEFINYSYDLQITGSGPL